MSNRNASDTAGLLCSSTPEFILTWLGLMRLGISVLILAYVIYLHPAPEREPDQCPFQSSARAHRYQAPVFIV